MSLTKWIVGLLLCLLIAAGFWTARGDRDDAAVVAALQRRRAGDAIEKSTAVTTVHRLTDQVIADGKQISQGWVVQVRDRARPRIKLPARPTARGGFADDAPRSAGREREPGLGFVGADACAECHRERHAGFRETGHYQTSAVCTADRVLGPLQPPGNQLQTDDPSWSIRMQSEDGQVAQVVQLLDWRFPIPMDVIVGSGKLAQTFLFWQQDALYESHVSYFTKTQMDGSGQWLASPGFEAVDANYARPIRVECLECHVTYIAKKEPPNRFHRESAIWGISCERCHGPGQQHVEFHQQTPSQTKAKFIVHPQDLSRQQQLDLCAQCHSGGFKFRQQPFRFRPGDDIDDFHKLYHPDSEDTGVHTSNQLTRLKQSECFKQSEMTCTTCHNPHQLQRGDLVAFSKACLKCHSALQCKQKTLTPVELAADCISCHMPRTVNVDMQDMVTKGLEVSSIDHFIRVDRKSDLAPHASR
ncbi:cytochrome C [Stieleria sp. TO1_6]|uniref:multiheme c-type cytochrome n=1 Tax=Stieleria tagensis TaxID=2956795 RepID=UPI00209A75AD|nr:multiheme c-type cytochrome [Stieleria tagensis]MCO8120188.1 cytochrome C [Stieleria tagensis]